MLNCLATFKNNFFEIKAKGHWYEFILNTEVTVFCTRPPVLMQFQKQIAICSDHHVLQSYNDCA